MSSRKRPTNHPVVEFSEAEVAAASQRRRARLSEQSDPAVVTHQDYHQHTNGVIVSRVMHLPSAEEPPAMHNWLNTDAANPRLAALGTIDLDEAAEQLSNLSFLEPTQGVKADLNMVPPILLQKGPRRKMDSVSFHYDFTELLV
ncbi:hypothetical protein VKT23_009957 [Stygiomarasmius scandens]|uniref:Uncharacterized protein n=1 Tax=Marasmiellus scandens TaxID=2682957 RepID=A0ABR1JDL6_9AGAR